MKELPILFSGPMVRAILDGRKTMTRRLVTPQPTALDGGAVLHWNGPMRYRKVFESDADFRRSWPEQSRFQVGRRMWVRETWYCDHAFCGDYSDPGHDPPRSREEQEAEWREHIYYRADGIPRFEADEVTWRPSIHMPRWASRLAGVVTACRVEELQEITEADAKAEGVEPVPCCHATCDMGHHRTAFEELWDSLNAERAPWLSNPWVEVVSFERVASRRWAQRRRGRSWSVRPSRGRAG